ncbi:MAG: metallophosphoesterase [Chitinivibrionales bacterium]|nr:metallophosphoesterase [Chitinivibrionales bacterium]MBD3358101.1 metallophosphoesterase [Chitinivibrionales bacterium]
MRIAIISDIHANLEALEATFEDIENQTIDEIICLGDIVGYCANPNECITLVNKKCPVTLLGNHDAAAVGKLSTQHFNIHAKIAIDWTAEHLNRKSKTYLENLPLRKHFDSITYVHSTPYEPQMWYYITSLEEAAFNFQFFDTTFCFVGHTHIPIIIVLDEKRELYVHQDTKIDFGDSGARYLINVGSVGQPRDHNPDSCYGIIDTEQQRYYARRVKYDLQKTQNKMRKIHMPEFLVTRLQEGK